MAFKLPPKPSFDYEPLREAKADSVPDPLQIESNVQWTGQLKQAGQIAPFLPNREGQSMHAIMTGRYDLTALLAMALDHYAEPCEWMRATTLSFNSKNVHQFASMFRGWLRGLSLLYSEFHEDHSPASCQEMRLLRDGHAGRFRLASARCHCKVVTLHFESGRKVVFEGSANLRTNSNQEQIAVFQSEPLHDWHAAWIDAMVAKHEIDTRGNSQTS